MITRRQFRARKAAFAPPAKPNPWDSGKMVDAASVTRAQIEAEADRREWLRKSGYKAAQFAQ